MQILAFTEHFYHVFILRQMRHHAQFYLTVVCWKEQTTRFWNKSLSDLLSILTTNGNILQVGIATRQSAGGCYRLVEWGMYMSCTRINQLRQCVDIGTYQFLQPPMFQDICYNLMLLRNCWSTSSEVTYWPVLVFFAFSTIFSLSKSISPTCFGDAILNGSPASS